ncbi:hypothetical protein Poli38472_011821 [Pythium oligandrum]|uniref:Uncharacterized protein n=1 Tax=Pythium oligandrum TaxID=41045 RepID=A0A8K1C887_PYTOL|nr:hypothetical protein Poli38472_011821 [Pythium oligandrum]|eukprot:TMW58233.1 hypothetical protein Poli38472_011821 [Pythium oligandrum]
MDGKPMVARVALVNRILHELDERHIVVVRGSRMTGKSSVATAISHVLQKMYAGNAKLHIFHFALAQWEINDTFEASFEEKFRVSWYHAAKVLPRSGYIVYLVVDDALVVDCEEKSLSPSLGNYAFWSVVRRLIPNLRVLLVVGDGSTLRSISYVSPVDLTRNVVDNKDLKFAHDEIREYVFKCFRGIGNLEVSEAIDMDTSRWFLVFCDHLEWLTGGHVGLCVATIDTLNK